MKFGVPEDALLAVQTLCGNPLPDGSIMGVYVRQGAVNAVDGDLVYIVDI